MGQRPGFRRGSRPPGKYADNILVVPDNVYNKKMIKGYLTTRQASERSGISQDHIRRLMWSGTLSGLKLGRDWLVEASSLDHYLLNRPKPGPKPTRK